MPQNGPASWSLVQQPSWKVLWSGQYPNGPGPYCVTTKLCDSHSQVLEFEFLGVACQCLSPWSWCLSFCISYLLFGADFLGLLGVGVAAWLFWVVASGCLVLIHTMLPGFLCTCSCLWLPAVDTGLPQFGMPGVELSWLWVKFSGHFPVLGWFVIWSW